MSHVVARNVHKIFGRDPQRGMRLLDRGVSREEMRDEHGLLVAVHDVSFEVERGELFVVMGLSGSGKSTLVRMINRLQQPTSGTVEIEGVEVGSLDDAGLRRLRAEKISMVFQHFGLFPHRKVWENVAYGLAVRGVAKEEQRRVAEETLEVVGLSGWADSPTQALSGGMQQRVGLGRALATQAEILLMDEPFSALDPLIRRDMQQLLLDLQEELQRTIIFITHDLNEAMRLGDRIMVLRDGAAVQVGTGAEIIADPATDYVADFVADVDRSRALTADAAMRRPRATARPDDHPREVLEELQDLELNGMYVLDEDGVILGVARDDRLAHGVREGVTEVGEILARDYSKVAPGTPLVNVAALAAGDPVPVAVTDPQRRLLGVVPRAALLTVLAGDEAGGAPRPDLPDADVPARDEQGDEGERTLELEEQRTTTETAPSVRTAEED